MDDHDFQLLHDHAEEGILLEIEASQGSGIVTQFGEILLLFCQPLCGREDQEQRREGGKDVFHACPPPPSRRSMLLERRRERADDVLPAVLLAVGE